MIVSTTRNICSELPNQVKSDKSLVGGILNSKDRAGRQGEGGLRTRGAYKKSIPERPLITIIVVVLNGVEYLEKTIQSVLDQDYDNIEFIVIDGGSSDGTLNVLKKYDHVIDYWVSEPDDGISDAFNKGVLLSSGDYLNFQGAGDYLVNSNVVSSVINGVDSARDMLISARVQRVREHDPEEILWIAPRTYAPGFNKRSLLLRMSLPHQSLLTNRRMFERYGLFDVSIKFSMDYEHLLRAYNNFPNVLMRDVVFAAWREGGVGSGKINDVLKEYAVIKKKNRVASPVLLALIYSWTIFKFKIKTVCMNLLSNCR